MKIYIKAVLLILFYLCFSQPGVVAQQATVQAKNMLNAGPANYTSFTAPLKNVTDEVLLNNKGYENHPEIGTLFAETPCDNCFELIANRTEKSKTFIKAGTNGRDIMQQTSSMPMHYKDADGNFKTIRAQLQSTNIKAIYTANEQETPVAINTPGAFTTLGKDNKQLTFNNQLELVYVKAGIEHNLGRANWDQHTAGDDGVYISNAWPGVDIELKVIRGAIKTNFIINHSLPAYTDGILKVRDHLHVSKEMSFNKSGEQHFSGNLEVINADGEPVYNLSAPVVFEKNAEKSTLKPLEYGLTGAGNDRNLDIILPGEWLDRPASAYPIIIDPLVSTVTSSAVTGSSYSPGPLWTVGCIYYNAATVPAKVTITDLQFSFQYITNGGSRLLNGAYDFQLGSCRSPSGSSLFWNCNSTLTGTCTATAASILSSLTSCIPAPTCSSYDLGITMNFYQNYATDATCGTAYIYAGTPLIFTVFGHTIDASAITASSSSFCIGSSTTLSATATNGVAPYSYSWAPGGMTGSSITVSPTTTTTYTVTATDACAGVASSTSTITVNPVLPVTGPSFVCRGTTATYSNGISGGTWVSSNTTVATVVSGTGVVTGVSVGTTTITYTTAAGCTSQLTISVIAPPASIIGAGPLCQSATLTLTDATSGGTWSSSNVGVATIGTSSGIVTGVSSGTARITYTASTGCTALATVTVNAISAIGGTLNVCLGGTTTLTDAALGGTWTSSRTAIATINSTTGAVTGVAAGTSIISYTTAAGCRATATMSVYLLPTITGPASVCEGNNITLADASTGGTWTSGSTSVATIIPSTGVLTGVGAGTTAITYTVPGGCFTNTIITVNAVAPITGTTTICVSATTTLHNTLMGGTWASLSPAVATIGASSGILLGVSPGLALIQYTNAAGCISSTTVTVLALPSDISGSTTVCQGSTTTLTSSTPGGTWTSSNTSVATIGILSGLVTGVSAGTAMITYTGSGGCYLTSNITVFPLSPIVGTSALCVGSSTTLTDATTGGTWFSSNIAVATINSTSGLLTAVATGTTIITYTTAAGCQASMTVTINALFGITGTSTVCQGSTTFLSNAVPGGTWSSSNISIASAGLTTGIVAGVSPGTAIVTYTTPGGCYTTILVTVNPLAPITGTASMCQGSGTTLSDATAGGTWNSANTTVATIGLTTGVVAGLSAGTSVISYTTIGGCVGIKVVTVNPLSAIAGSTTLCQGSTTTLSNTVSGGTWTSSNTGVATIGAGTGLVTGAGSGTSIISYVNPYGCASSQVIIVYPLAPISGFTAVCKGNTTSLTDATPGGTWTSSNTTVASISVSGGLVSGLSAGTTIISYTTPAGCIATYTITVNPISPITGITSFCSTTTLSDATPGGTWTSSNPPVASIGLTTGSVTSFGPGTAIITYTTGAGCVATTTVTVNAFVPITGTPSVCVGNVTTLTNTVAGGTWISSVPAIASVGASTGDVTGNTAGTVIISYTTPSGCLSTLLFSVYPRLPIAGTTTVCMGSTTVMTNGVPGGRWTSSAPLIVGIGLTTGIVAGVTSGTSIITYTTPSGCISTTLITVNPLYPISGPTTVCQGSNVTLNDLPYTGGTWRSNNTAIATIDLTSGVLTGISAGTSLISYTTIEGCVGTMVMAVTPLFPITGLFSICQGSNSTLSDLAPGGTWASSDPGIAPIGTFTGTVNGLASGTAIITYTTPAGCTATNGVTVNPLNPIAGTLAICAGTTTTLYNSTPGGGTWSSSRVGVATIDPSTGVANGISAGTSIMSFTTMTGCLATTTLTVFAYPAPIAGITSVCVGKFTLLTNTLLGGSWTSTNLAVATIGFSSGMVSGIAPGTSLISYIVSGGCYVNTVVTVNANPPAITGLSSICESNTTTLSNTYPGGTWSSSNIIVCSIGSTSGLLTGLSAGIATITYTTPEGCIATLPVVINQLPPAITGTTTVCAGSSTPLANSLSGGTWSSNNTAIATVGISTGLVTGINPGTTIITYSTPSGCYVTTVVLVNPTPGITGTLFTNPSTCINADGTITLRGLPPGETYTVNYLDGIIAVTISLTANISGQVVITGLAAGSYSNFSVTNRFGCTSNIVVGPIVLVLPAPPPVPTASNTSPVCDGTNVTLNATDPASGVRWSWTGPGGFTSTLQNPVLSPAHMAQSGTYSVTATLLECTSAAATTIVVVHPIPTITNLTHTNPTSCQGAEGTITLSGLDAGVSYLVHYTHSSITTTITLVANASGKVTITGLSSGTYSNIYVSSYTCTSNTVGPVTLTDPLAPPIPTLGSNSPICSGRTLFLTCTIAGSNYEFEWTGPNGFTSNDQNPNIPDITLSDSGYYTVVVKSHNCPSTATTKVTVHPPVVLSNVTPSHMIPYGSSVELHAEGALIYIWLPANGSIANPGEATTDATPEVETTYYVIGMNSWGCTDTGAVDITIDYNVNEYLPNSFTPNNDGHNDIFRLGNIKYDKLVDFSIFNRWGELVYHNTYDPTKGWDGYYNGVPQDIGVYNYNIILGTPNGTLKYLKGTVTLIR